MLKNSDGSPYQLRKPNPLTQNQENWFTEQLELHNCKWQSATTSDETKPTPIKTREPEPVIPQEIPIPKEEPAMFEPDPLPQTQTLPQNVLDKMIIMHTMPAITQTVHDDFYGEDRQTTSYKEQRIIDGVIIKRGDLIMQFWTMEEITIDSIVYPSRYKKTGIKFGEYRWWKVQSVEEKTGGTLCQCIPSSIQPDFT